MERARSRGVTFWGWLLIYLGVVYGKVLANEKWRIDYVGFPILLVLLGIGILRLKNWARILSLVYMSFLLLSGIFGIPWFLSAISGFKKEGVFYLQLIMFLFRFVLGISGIIFFLIPEVKAQFNKENSL